MERLRILGAAAALREFTVAELSAFSGANAETVRSVLRRDAELLEIAQGESDGGPGRPANRYRVKDLDRVRDEIRRLEEVFQPAVLRTQGRPEHDSQEDRLLAVVSGEDAVLDSWHAQEPRQRTVLALTALAALRAARRMVSEESVDADDPLLRRTADIEVFAQLAYAEARGEPIGTEDLHRAAEALSDLSEVAPDRTSLFLHELTAIAVRNDQLPPLALALSPSLEPVDAIHTLDAGSWVKAGSLAGTAYDIWWERWAAPLANHGLFAGVVVQDDGGVSIDAPLVHLSKWRGPTIVLSKRHSVDLVSQVSESAAFFLPTSAGAPGITRTVINASEHAVVDMAAHAIKTSLFDSVLFQPTRSAGR